MNGDALDELDEQGAEIARLREENRGLNEAIRRLAEQDATLSVCNGNVTVTMDGTLTAAEREALEVAIAYLQPVGNYDSRVQATLRGLLERLG